MRDTLRAIVLAVIFDCDGVLVDSERLSCGSWLPVLKRRGIDATLSDIEPFIGKSDRAVFEHFSRLSGARLDVDVLVERQSEYFTQARGRLAAFAGLREVLLELGQRRVKLGVASSGHPDKIRFNLEQARLDGFFDTITSATEVEHGKPAPDLFLLAANRLGVRAEDCAVVEDSVYGIRAARSAGMWAIGYTSSHPASVLEQAGADRVFDHYAELLPLLGAGVADLHNSCPIPLK